MKHLIAGSALLAMSAVASQAATINVTDFAGPALAADSNMVVEDFEGFSEGNVANGFSTAVGTFATLGGTGSGGTVQGSVASGNFAGNDGALLAIRDGNVYGRESTTPGAGNDKFLDSNDTFGIRWNVSLGGAAFTKLVFTLMDAAEFGAGFEITTGGTTTVLSSLGNGATKLVEIIFDTPVTTAEVLFANVDGNGNYRTNDGFSLDDIGVSPVPLPAAGWLLLAGLGGLGAMKRRKSQR